MSSPTGASAAIAGIPAGWWLRLAHDLRGPVAPMRMAVQMMRGGWVSASDQEEALRMMDRQIDALLAGIDDLGELMRLNAGSYAFQPQEANLADVLERVAGKSSLQRWLLDRQKRLATEAPPTPLVASHDPQRLAGVLEFLVRKAAQHAGAGLVVLGLRADAGRARWSIHGSGASLASDPELRLLAGDSDALEECEARCLLVREAIHRHGMAFEPLREGSIAVSMECSA